MKPTIEQPLTFRWLGVFDGITDSQWLRQMLKS